MNTLFTELLRNCYGVVLCVAIILSFLASFKNYDKKVVKYFWILCILVFVESIFSTVEIYLGKQDTYSPWRLFLSWVCYLTTPAMILMETELLLRNDKPIKRWLIAVPEFINVLVTSTCFFSPICFHFNQQKNLYVEGPLVFVPRVSIVVYIVLLIIVSFSNVRKSKTECIIALVGAAFAIFDVANETMVLFSVNLRETTVALTLLMFFIYFTGLNHLDEVNELNNTFNKAEEHFTKEMLDQSIETLAYTIEAKDRYTKGHSSRVAKYARMIGGMCDKSTEECEMIYRAGLLHDIGKISVSGEIINKPGKLTPEEYEKMKLHTVNGAIILEKMKSIPYIQEGAKYHHERYDGKGYPSGLKGDEIPELARIISVADAYDAMTSFRSYRKTMDRMDVKQEIWKGMGTQFDPYFAKMMISLIDADSNYDMREKPEEANEIVFDKENEKIEWPTISNEDAERIVMLQETDLNTLGAYIMAEEYWSNPTRGVPVTAFESKFTVKSVTRNGDIHVWCAPAAIVFSSDDGKILGPNYEELGVCMSAGYGWKVSSTLFEETDFVRNEGFESWDNWVSKNKAGMTYTIKTRFEDNMVLLEISNECITTYGKFTIPEDYDKTIYVAISGEWCDVSDLEIL